MEDDVPGLLPMPAAQAHLGCGGHGAPWPTSPGTALTLAPGFPQIRGQLPADPYQCGGGQGRRPVLHLLPRAQTETQRDGSVFLL